MADRFEQLSSFVADLSDDFNKFYGKKNKAAGTRVRKSMQELKKMAREIRIEVQNQKNSM